MKSVPCAGCGLVTLYGKPRWTKAKPLCRGCLGKLTEHPKLVAALKGRHPDVREVPTSTDVWNWWDRTYQPKSWRYGGCEAEEVFGKAILKLLACFPEVTVEPSDKAFFGRGFNNTRRAFPIGFPDALLQLLSAWGFHATQAFKDGQEAGAHLLGQLMDGSVTNEEINERAKENKG